MDRAGEMIATIPSETLKQTDAVLVNFFGVDRYNDDKDEDMKDPLNDVFLDKMRSQMV